MIASRLLTMTLLLLIAGVLVARPAHAELRVVVTSKPVHALTAAVMSDVGVPDLLVSGSASPHSFAMRPSDAQKVNAADVFIRVSEVLEPFTGKVMAALPKSVSAISLAEAPGLTLLERRRGGAFEAHDHGHGHGHNHRHSVSGTRGKASIDPHIWLDPDNAKILVDYIAERLSARAPEKAAAFRANAEAEKSKIDQLAAEIGQELAPLAGKPFIVYHDAYQYLEKRFGLEAVGSITVNPEVPPSGKRLQNLRNTIRSKGAVCVFAEPQFESRVTGVVVEGTTARTGTLDPEGTTLTPGPELYAALMRKLTDGLKSCLSGAA